jgi:hypothetical protein
MNFPRAADIGFTCLTIVLVGLAATSYLKPVAGESRQEVFPAGSELPMAYPQPTGVGQVLLAFKSCPDTTVPAVWFPALPQKSVDLLYPDLPATN